MNKVYTLVWNVVTNSFTVVSENSKRNRGKNTTSLNICTVVLLSVVTFSTFARADSASDAAAAAGSATAAAGSATAAANSATAAANSETAAAGSETAAAGSATKAANSTTAAANSATAAASSATKAANSATAAAGSETAAANSATAAAGSETAAASSAIAAAGSETAAADSAAAAASKVEYLENNADLFVRNSQAFQELDSKVGSNRKLAAQGIAGLAAMANIPSPAIVGSTTSGLGIGYFDNEAAISIGASHYLENNVSVKGAFSRVCPHLALHQINEQAKNNIDL